ncbi:hypothetical protein ACQEVZ_39300 [Dactylosporangium sp. CA-152071]|uniref:hypothetical protein n=1 Tax=Dactylosporangium sp. CA-152071 TaxID=3239933 RepID=UPI003D8F2D81
MIKTDKEEQRRGRAGNSVSDDSHQGGDCALVQPEDFDPRAQALALEAAALMGSEVAGINVIQHWTSGQWFILDANVNPAIAGGAFVEQKVAAYRSYLRDRIRQAAARPAQVHPFHF